MDNNFNKKNNYNDNKTWTIVAEILRLLALLCWKGIKALGRLLKKLGKFLLKIIVKGILWIIDATDKLITKTKLFWNDNNTQDKIRKISKAIKNAAKAVGKAIIIALVAIFKAIVWTLKKAFNGLIHLKSTSKTVWKCIKKYANIFAKWTVKVARKFAQWVQIQKIKYKNFRKNKGFKGLLLDMRNGLNGHITSYLDEEQEEEVDNNTQENIDTDNFIDIDENLPDKGLTGFGKKLYKAMKNIVDE